MNIITENLFNIFNSGFSSLTLFLPKLIAGIILLLVGLILSSILKDILKLVFKYFRLDKWFETAGLVKENDVNIWSEILAELVRWSTIFLFLISAVDLWGLPKVGEVLNQLLMFLPNVFVAVVVGLAGIVLSNFAFNIVRHGVRGLGGKESLILGNVAKYAIVFFTILIILTQLGVAAELVKILFTGIIGMLALAFGLSFGLGGQDEARNILKELKHKIDNKPLEKPRRK
jgi:hypothetical protein